MVCRAKTKTNQSKRMMTPLVGQVIGLHQLRPRKFAGNPSPPKLGILFCNCFCLNATPSQTIFFGCLAGSGAFCLVCSKSSVDNFVYLAFVTSCKHFTMSGSEMRFFFSKISTSLYIVQCFEIFKARNGVYGVVWRWPCGLHSFHVSSLL